MTVTTAIIDGPETVIPTPEYHTYSQSGEKHETFAIKRAGIRLFGGYPSNGGVRAPDVNITYLDGQLTNYKVYHVVCVGTYDTNFMTDSLVIDGFTIRNGHAKGTSQVYGGGFGIPESKGGGIIALFVPNATNTEKLAIRNCTFQSDSANYGGALYIQYSNGSVSNCKFISNQSSFSGGAVCNFEGSVKYSNCLFNNCSSSYYGGSVYNYKGTPEFINCDFTYGLSNLVAGAVFNTESNAKFQGCNFKNNISRNVSGAVTNYLGKPTYSYCLFENNSSDSTAGAMYNYGSGALLSNTDFTGNSANKLAGAIFYRHASTGNPQITNCNFTGNTTSNSTDFNAGHGGAIFIDSLASPEFMHCAFKTNYSYRSGVSYVQDNASAIFSNCNFENNTSNYSAAVCFNLNAKIVFKGCKFFNNECNQASDVKPNFGALGSVIKNHGNTTFSHCVFGGNNSNNTTSDNYAAIIFNFDSLNIINSVFGLNAIVNGSVIYGGENTLTDISLSTFANNGGTWSSSFMGTPQSDLKINNSIFSDLGLYFRDAQGSYTVKNTYATKSSIGTRGTEENFVFGDPLFFDKDNVKGTDNILGTNDDGIQLQSSSPCINAGNNLLSKDTITDILGNARIKGTIDIGAYEYHDLKPGTALSLNGINEYQQFSD